LTLTGTIRDFKDGTQAGGHPDFETFLGDDRGIVKNTLGVDGKPVYNGMPTTPTTTGQTNFDQWYRDVSGVNLSTPLSITLTDPENDGIFTYANGNFFPIDGQLFGNQGRPHNYHFTYELHSQFTYQGGETFSFTGDDDVWVFINNQLVIDLGGVHGTQTASVSLDKLGLTVGQAYNLDVFFAERHTVASNFGIDTSLLLEQKPASTPEPASTLGILALGVLAAGSCLKQKLSQAKESKQDN